MNSVIPLAKVRALAQACVEREDSLDWANVRRVPSTRTWKTVDYVRALGWDRRALLCQAFAANAVGMIDPARATTPGAETPESHALEALRQTLAQTWDWGYADVRLLRGLLARRSETHTGRRWTNPPSDVLERARAIRPTNAREIRNAVEQAFRGRYAARPEKLGGGDWRYAGVHRGRPFAVSIDYGGWYQLRYLLEYDDARSGLRPRMLNYERLVGPGLGNWDSLTADNLEESVALLCDLVERLVELPDVLEDP